MLEKTVIGIEKKWKIQEGWSDKSDVATKKKKKEDTFFSFFTGYQNLHSFYRLTPTDAPRHHGGSFSLVESLQ